MHTNIRVIYITNDSNTSGSSLALQNILIHIIPRGVIPMVVCRNEGDFTNWLKEHEIQYRIFNYNWNFQPNKNGLYNKLVYPWRLFKYYREESRVKKDLRKLCLEFKPDIIHTNNGILHFGYKVAKELGIKHIWHLREYQDKDFGITPIPSMPRFKKMAQNGFCVCITKDIQKYFELNEDKSIVVYDGVMPIHSERYTPSKDNYFLFVGRIEASKGIEELIQAYYLYVKKGGITPLWVAGDGVKEYVNTIKETVNNLKFKDKIIFLGFRSDRFDLMYKAKSTIVPSRFEGFGFITIEAIINGCQVIGHNAGGTAEIASYCKKQVQLYDTPEHLCEKMLSFTALSYNDIKNDQMIANNLFTNQVSAEQIFNFYKYVVE